MSARRQVDLLVCATQFLTRLPTPQLTNFQGEWITRSARYFPIVGQLVGGVCALIWWVGQRFWPGTPAAVLAVAAGVLTTGGFHEDGLADTADGLGGGQTREARLLIMKDSRLGSFGALAIGLVLVLKVALLARLGSANGALALVAIHGGGRAAAVVAMAALPYAGDVETAKSKPTPNGVAAWEAFAALAFAAWPFALFPPYPALLGVSLAVVAAACTALISRRLIGGVTGDVLGAIEQLGEVALLMGLTVLG